MSDPAWNKDIGEDAEDGQNPYQELKRLLLSDEQASLQELQAHVLNKEQRTEDIADVLSESIDIASRDPARLSSSLSGVIHGSIRDLIKKDPKQFADALFPVMGPAIRKSINETLKSFMQSLNHVLEQNMSLQGLQWRWEAWRKGVRYSDLVLKKTLVYRVDEAFLIQKDSGLLISHVAHSDVDLSDSDAVSAMLSAIQDFIRDSFAADKSSGLETVELGDHTLWVVAGPRAILACAIRGIAPLDLRAQFQATLEDIHGQYEDNLIEFDGDREQIGGVEDMVRSCLHDQRTESVKDQPKQFLSVPLLIILSVLILIIAIITWRDIHLTDRFTQLQTELDARQGIIVYAANMEDEPYTIRLLKDPLADKISDIQALYGFDDDELIIETKPFQSLDPGISLRRAKQILQPPETVTFTSANNILFIRGKALLDWVEHIKQISTAIPGYGHIDISALTSDYSEIIGNARQALQIPETVIAEFDGQELRLSGTAPVEWILWQQSQSVSIEDVIRITSDAVVPDRDTLRLWARQTLQVPEKMQFDIVDKHIRFLGIAPYQWAKSLAGEIERNPWFDSFAISEDVTLEMVELDRIKDLIDEMSIFFAEATVAVSHTEQRLDWLRDKLKRAIELANILDREIKIEVTGYADGVGSERQNISLSKERAGWVKQKIIGRGIEEKFIDVKHGVLSQSSEADPVLRRVDLLLVIESSGN